MAISPKTRYPGKIDISDLVNYPDGKAQNITVPGDQTGTPYEKDLVNDIFGFQQKLLAEAGIVPSGAPDNAVTSQYYDALIQLTVAKSLSGYIGRIWDLVDDPADSSWEGLAYSPTLKRFVAVADSSVDASDRIMYSDDGVTWNLATAPNTNQWRAVTWGNGLFVAVSDTGTGDRVMTSPDGITWTSRTSSVDSAWQDVTYGNGLFVAVATSGPGTNDQIMTSPDGITWTTRNNQVDEPWFRVEWLNDKFIALTGTSTPSTNDLLTSSDGITWTAGNTGALASWKGLSYSPKLGLYTAVGTNRFYTSTNGTSWTAGTPASDNEWQDILWVENCFVKTSIYDSPSGDNWQCAVSYDGIKWTEHNVPKGSSSSWTKLAYGNNLLVAIADVGLGKKIMISGLAG